MVSGLFLCRRAVGYVFELWFGVGVMVSSGRRVATRNGRREFFRLLVWKRKYYNMVNRVVAAPKTPTVPVIVDAFPMHQPITVDAVMKRVKRASMVYFCL
jgi:hypothetical protein